MDGKATAEVRAESSNFTNHLQFVPFGVQSGRRIRQEIRCLGLFYQTVEGVNAAADAIWSSSNFVCSAIALNPTQQSGHLSNS